MSHQPDGQTSGMGPISSGGQLRFGYGTNGLADHRLEDALTLLADLGYDGVALTLDHHHLDPFAPDLAARTAAVARQLDQLNLAVVIETGARYLLDPWHKHEPTLLSDDPQPRAALLRRAVDVGADLGAQAVSFWSGTRPLGLDLQTAWARLVAGCTAVLAHAEYRGVTLGFEPEPGMLVERLDDYERLATELGEDPRFGLTLDVGHAWCLEDESPAACVRRAGSRLVNIQIEDMRRGVHEHLDFGEGEIDFPPVLAAIREVGYQGLVTVELPRHSHAGPTVAAWAIEFLRAAEQVAA
jgi:L-ribulose-5-phosphate 3-epimerase